MFQERGPALLTRRRKLEIHIYIHRVNSSTGKRSVRIKSYLAAHRNSIPVWRHFIFLSFSCVSKTGVKGSLRECWRHETKTSDPEMPGLSRCIRGIIYGQTCAFSCCRHFISPILLLTATINLTMHLILTGATGLIGSGVLDAMLATPEISRLSILSRRPVPLLEDRIKAGDPTASPTVFVSFCTATSASTTSHYYNN